MGGPLLVIPLLGEDVPQAGAFLLPLGRVQRQVAPVPPLFPLIVDWLLNLNYVELLRMSRAAYFKNEPRRGWYPPMAS